MVTTALQPSFHPIHTVNSLRPPIAGDYQYKLTVRDTNYAMHSATVTVTVNTPPMANAGDDKTTYRGETVELNGSGSDPDGHSLTYRWEQLGLDELGVAPTTPVTINAADQANATFVAPNEIGALSFQLTVTDRLGGSHSDTVDVTIQNPPPHSPCWPEQSHQLQQSGHP